jgi:CBS domain-containing protein
MAFIFDLVRNQQTYGADPSQSVLEVARAMVERNIGAVPILREGALVGILSERDLMKRIVAEGRDPARTRVSEIMTPEPHAVGPREDLETCMLLMSQHGFRHLPICDGKKLIGVVSLRDIMLHGLNEKDHEVRMMRAYIHSTPQI